jgi:hypothetical protein
VADLRTEPGGSTVRGFVSQLRLTEHQRDEGNNVPCPLRGTFSRLSGNRRLHHRCGERTDHFGSFAAALICSASFPNETAPKLNQLQFEHQVMVPFHRLMQTRIRQMSWPGSLLAAWF